ncbi:unnamed protein product [Moneuplotes crassus]|uniref:Uncharacterized protein n=1 Tax=Euplotes crassus TaxID=5936 RepID=A0AAD1XAU7_EUPCR|nr:unnamed protein product [Moneuplotes crassus]
MNTQPRGQNSSKKGTSYLNQDLELPFDRIFKNPRKIPNILSHSKLSSKYKPRSVNKRPKLHPKNSTHKYPKIPKISSITEVRRESRKSEERIKRVILNKYVNQPSESENRRNGEEFTYLCGMEEGIKRKEHKKRSSKESGEAKESEGEMEVGKLESRNEEWVNEGCQTANYATPACEAIESSYIIRHAITNPRSQHYSRQPSSCSRGCSRTTKNNFIIQKPSDIEGDLSSRRNCMPTKNIKWYLTNQIAPSKLGKHAINRYKRNNKNKLSSTDKNGRFIKSLKYKSNQKKHKRFVVKGLQYKDPKIIDKNCNLNMVKIYSLLKEKLSKRIQRRQKKSKRTSPVLESSVRETPQRSQIKQSQAKRFLHLSPFGRGTLTGLVSYKGSFRQ